MLHVTVSRYLDGPRAHQLCMSLQQRRSRGQFMARLNLSYVEAWCPRRKDGTTPYAKVVGSRGEVFDVPRCVVALTLGGGLTDRTCTSDPALP